MRKWIAERKLVAVSISTGEKKNIVVRVGMPFQDEDDEFASCPVEWDGLFGRIADSKGIDKVQALQLALDIDSMVKILSDKYQFFWLSGESYSDED
jgi:hypothetical protein